MSALFISSLIDPSLLSGSDQDRAVDQMYLDRIGISGGYENDYVAISSPIGFRSWEVCDPRDYSAMNSDTRGDYQVLVNHANLIASRYGREVLRSRAENLYHQAMGD